MDLGHCPALFSAEIWEANVPMSPVISIVDDDESVREATMDLIRAMGFVAEAFERADDFFKSDCLHSTGCLIADMRMPGMSGLELHSRLVGLGNAIPTILITAFPDDRDRERAMRNGVICYLTKPCVENELVEYIRLALAQ